MNIKEFQNKYKCNIKTIEKWLEIGYIRGAKICEDTGEWKIPNNARPPYTKRGNIKNIGIYKSVARGVFQNYDVFAELYDFTEEMFSYHMQLMINSGYIAPFKSKEGIIYYLATPKTEELLKKTNSKIAEILNSVSSAVKFISDVKSFIA